MPVSRVQQPSSVARCRDAASAGALIRRGVRGWRVIALGAALVAGCSGPTSYRGTGAIQTSGSASTELATHVVSITTCRGTTFSSLAIGDQCTIDGSWFRNTFRGDTGTLCTLFFSGGGSRALRVTDATARHGQNGRKTDPGYVEIQIGGSDTESGTQLLYRFSGAAVASGDHTNRCPKW
jgi:hypothetical protein